MLNISEIYACQARSLYCATAQTILDECGCLEKEGKQGRQKMDQLTQAYNQALQVIAAKYAALNDPNFIAVYQPTLAATVIPPHTKANEILSKLDCFHPNYFSHAHMGIGLWNNMLTPPSQKQSINEPLAPPLCPTINTFIQ